MSIDAGVHPKTAHAERLGAALRSRAAIDQTGAANFRLGVIMRQVTGDGIKVDVELQPLGDVAKETVFDKMLGTLPHRIKVVDVQIKIAGLGVFLKPLAAFADRQNYAGFLVVMPNFDSLKELLEIGLVDPDGFGEIAIDVFAIDELDFKFFDGVVMCVPQLSGFRGIVFEGVKKEAYG